LNTYDIGDLVRLSVDFTVSGVYTDPTAVTLKLRSPAGVETTSTYNGVAQVPPITRSSAGRFYADFAPTAEGVWEYRYAGTGLVQAAERAEFFVNPIW
jgi:hypothetical protein